MFVDNFKCWKEKGKSFLKCGLTATNAMIYDIRKTEEERFWCTDGEGRSKEEMVNLIVDGLI